eukprot:4092549-Pyramimonas_sp.AAC.1
MVLLVRLAHGARALTNATTVRASWMFAQPSWNLDCTSCEGMWASMKRCRSWPVTLLPLGATQAALLLNPPVVSIRESSGS